MNASAAPNASPPTVAAVVLARNDAEMISRTLESVRRFADELIVIDLASTDGTPEVARGLGAKVVRQPWRHDLAEARNTAWQSVSCDWLLWLDAGEQLVAGTAGELREFVAKADRDKVYAVFVELPGSEPAASPEQAAQLRLTPNRPDLRFAGRVRETLQPAIATAGLATELAPGRIVGRSGNLDPAWKTRKAQVQLCIAQEELASGAAPSPQIWLAMGDAHADLAQKEQARDCFSKAAELAAPGSTELLEAFYGWLAAIDSDENSLSEQTRIGLRALEAFPLDAQLLMAMGNCLQRQDRLDLAVRAFEAAAVHGRVNLSTWHLRDLPEVAASCWSLLLQLQDKPAEARRVLEEALGRCGDAPRLLGQLLDLVVKQGEDEQALAIAARLPLPLGEVEPFREAVRGACQASRQQWTAALGYLQAAHLSGCRHPFCLRWLAVTLLSNGQIEAAIPVLREWQAVEPANAELRSYWAAVESMATASGESSLPAGSVAQKVVRIDSPDSVDVARPAFQTEQIHRVNAIDHPD